MTNNLLTNYAMLKTEIIFQRRFMARKLQPEEWDLWRRVADTAIPIQPLAAVKPQGLAKIINKVKNAQMEIYDISTDEGNLEDVFIDLTKNQISL